MAVRTNKHNDIQHCVAPLNFAGKIFAITSHRVSVMNGRKQLRESKVLLAYDMCFCCAFFVLYWCVRGASTFPAIFDLHVDVIAMALNIFACAANRAKIIEAQEDLMKIDERFKTYLGVEMDYERARFLISGYALVSSWLLIALECFRCGSTRQPKSHCVYCVMLLVAVFVKNLVEIQFTSHVYLLRQRFGKLNSALNFARRRPLKEKQAAILSAARKLHAQLCEAGRCVNEAFSFQALVTIGSDFVAVATWTYYCYVDFSQLLVGGGVSWRTTVSLAFCTAYRLLQIFLVCFMCGSASNEANATREVLYKADVSDTAVSTEVCFFGQQIAHWRFKFTAFDFFDINLSLVYSVVCAATMYLLIFIQLDLGN